MKKFLIILLAFFLIIPKTFAYYNYDTYYNLTINELTLMNNTYGDTSYTIKQVFKQFSEVETSNYYLITISFMPSNNSITNIIVNVYENYPTITAETFTTGAQKNNFYYMRTNTGVTRKTKTFTTFNSSSIDEIKSCISSYSSCLWGTASNRINSMWYFDSSVTDNNANFDASFPPIDANSYGVTDFPLLSNFGIVFKRTGSYVNNSSYYYKSLKVNNHVIENDTYLPTYFDLYPLTDPEPDDPDDPVNPDDPDEPTSTDFTSWIYWFSEPSDSTSVLNNIYTLLFLYCVSMLILKTYYIIKDKK